MFDKILVASVPGAFALGMVVTLVLAIVGAGHDSGTMVGHVILATQLAAVAVGGYRKLNAVHAEVKNGNGNHQDEGSSRR